MIEKIILKTKEIIILYIFLIHPHLKKINIMEYYYLYMVVRGIMELKKNNGLYSIIRRL